MKKIIISSLLIAATTTVYGNWNWNPFGNDAISNCAEEAQTVQWSCSLNMGSHKCYDARERLHICRAIENDRSDRRRDRQIQHKIDNYAEELNRQVEDGTYQDRSSGSLADQRKQL